MDEYLYDDRWEDLEYAMDDRNLQFVKYASYTDHYVFADTSGRGDMCLLFNSIDEIEDFLMEG